MAQLADVVTTVHALAAGNVEQNPLNEWVLRNYGSFGLLAGKGLAVLVIVAALDAHSCAIGTRSRAADRHRHDDRRAVERPLRLTRRTPGDG